MSKKRILNPTIVREKLEDEAGIIFGLEGDDAKAFCLDRWSANFDINSNWAEGSEDLIIYTETSADGYDLWICTDDHNGPRNIGEDVYYYQDNEQFMERALDTLYHGGSVWIDSYIADDISTEIDEAFETAYQEWYEEKFEEYQNELINDGYELHEDHK